MKKKMEKLGIVCQHRRCTIDNNDRYAENRSILAGAPLNRQQPGVGRRFEECKTRENGASSPFSIIKISVVAAGKRLARPSSSRRPSSETKAAEEEKRRKTLSSKSFDIQRGIGARGKRYRARGDPSTHEAPHKAKGRSRTL